MMPHDLTTRRAALAAVAMLGTAGLSQALVPTRYMSASRGNFQLDTAVPSSFGEWRIDPYASGGVVNPQTEDLLKKLYSQLLSRTYLHRNGQRIMLAIAYGADQSDVSVQLHYPEVCYPAQGFQVKSNTRDQIQLPPGPIAVRRLDTHLGKGRPEPVTYWTVIGDLVSLSSWEQRKATIFHGLRGEIVDGMLVRVSSISADPAEGYRLHDRFVRDLLAALDSNAQLRLFGKF